MDQRACKLSFYAHKAQQCCVRGMCTDSIHRTLRSVILTLRMDMQFISTSQS